MTLVSSLSGEGTGDGERENEYEYENDGRRVRSSP